MDVRAALVATVGCAGRCARRSRSGFVCPCGCLQRPRGISSRAHAAAAAGERAAGASECFEGPAAGIATRTTSLSNFHSFKGFAWFKGQTVAGTKRKDSHVGAPVRKVSRRHGEHKSQWREQRGCREHRDKFTSRNPHGRGNRRNDDP